MQTRWKARSRNCENCAAWLTKSPQKLETLQDAIKSEMTARNTDTLTGTDWKITWKAVTSKRFDSAAFKKTHGELYDQYTKETTSKRFLIA